MKIFHFSNENRRGSLFDVSTGFGVVFRISSLISSSVVSVNLSISKQFIEDNSFYIFMFKHMNGLWRV